MSPEALIDLIASLRKKLPKDVHGLRSAVDRSGEGAGMTLSIDLLGESRTAALGKSGWLAPEADVSKDVPYAWHYNERVSIGQRSLHSLSGLGSASHWMEKGNPELHKALTAAFAAAPSQPIEVRIQLLAEWIK